MVKPLFSAVWSVDFNDNHSLNCHHDLCAALYNIMEFYIHIDVFPPLPFLPPQPSSTPSSPRPLLTKLDEQHVDFDPLSPLSCIYMFDVYILYVRILSKNLGGPRSISTRIPVPYRLPVLNLSVQ